MTRHRALLESALLADRLPIFVDAERRIADPVVRNRGTIGGALCQADPSEDLSAVCAAVGAHMVIRGGDGERVVDMATFHRGPYRTDVGPAEMLIEIRVPLAQRCGSAYEKVDRRVGDWAVAAAGTAVTLAADGTRAARGRRAGRGGQRDHHRARPRRRWSATCPTTTASPRPPRWRRRAARRSATSAGRRSTSATSWASSCERALRRATARARGEQVNPGGEACRS